jgi:PAS domain S-box-containing protein
VTESPIHVLLVEDNPGDARLIRTHLADAGADGFTVATVGTLADAAERCARPGVDAVLLDLGLPDSVGLDTLRAIRARAPDLPVLVLTGLDDEKTAVQAVQDGAQDYLVKGEIVGALVARALRYAVARQQAESYRKMGLEVLQILNGPGETRDVCQRVIAALRTRTGLDAVGMRLQDGDDFPYIAQQGFPEDFLRTENALAARGAESGAGRGNGSKANLDCTCGLVISGGTDPSHPLFTRGGSFWTSDSFPLLDLPPEQDPRLRPRNECIRYGFASIALIPIRDKDRIVGLLHLNGRRKGCFTLATVELLEGIASHVAAALLRKQAEEALRASEERLDLALKSAHMGVWQWDIAADKLSSDAQACSLLGLDPATCSGSVPEFYEAVHPDDRESIREALSRTVEQDEMYAPEFRAVWPDGSLHDISACGRLTRDKAGQPHSLSGVVWDITERKLAESELLIMQKLRSVGTLAGGIAHDFNNILHGLYGYISLAKEDLAKDNPACASLEQAEKSMGRAVRLTKQLLTFSKGGAPVKETVSLESLVEEVARFDLSGSNVRLVCPHAEGLWRAVVDKGQIQQVVSNLVINARQAMPDGGALYVTLENAELPAAAFPGLLPGRYVKVTVRDEGVGIDPAIIDRIFEPYFTTRPTGSGLGLATVWSIVSKHGGHIGVVSQRGKGASFTFYLPAFEASVPQETPPPAAEGPAPVQTRTAKILVMDDDEDVRVIATRILTRCGYSVVTVPNAPEAVARYKRALEAGEPFGAVIMDLTIPGGAGGQKAVKDLLELDPNVRAIVSSGYAEDPVMADPAAYGFKDSTPKPYSDSELRDVVARVLV